ncbi:MULTISPECIES: DUF4912 domain-containing protein [unclassified Treponema]|uniref:DUF4912 domain-containing protein n=1 Tax=unclassified Treponema TaxID=2638727 RepID=UPI0020A47CC9|nr:MULTISPECIES: DUF4912 domain-containing protein [unclassified Treponema]UTC65942.1 DUF4912 domain-containing protein [Treponema sp. OMZ 789]UTC68670.1 DUF4912 domain-containing protein [Treponema sp. OMZ 790]UTC71400.1 DUF4912 domain-containing protein [Treponema sp. OMZ 791]
MNLSKSYLQSISTDELLQIADANGVFVPKGLCRNLVIEELLEINEDSDVLCKKISNAQNDDVFQEDEQEDKNSLGLPLSYNNTEIHVLLRDPMWAFVFWDFYKPEFLTVVDDFDFDSFFLRVLLFSENDLSESYDYFDIDIEKSDRSRYFYLSFDDSATMVELCVRKLEGDIGILARSNLISLKRENISNNLCVLDNDVSSPVCLSGISVLKKDHFKNYRQAFRGKEEA